MGNSDLVPVTPEHVASLAISMREADMDELTAAGFSTTLEALVTSLGHSEHCWTLLIENEVAAIGGVCQFSGSLLGTSGCGQIWCLTGRIVDKHRLTFFRWSRWLLAELMRMYDWLVNEVDARYQGALDWLECLGFRISEQRPHSKTGAPFHFVSIGRA